MRTRQDKITAEDVRDICELAKQYEDNLGGRDITFYQQRPDGEVDELTVEFRAMNFIHLIGISKRPDLEVGAATLYRKALDGTLDESDIEFSHYRRLYQLKAQGLSKLLHIANGPSTAGQPTSDGFKYSNFSAVLSYGTSCFGLGQAGETTYPASVLKCDPDEITVPETTAKTLAVVVRDIRDKSLPPYLSFAERFTDTEQRRAVVARMMQGRFPNPTVLAENCHRIAYKVLGSYLEDATRMRVTATFDERRQACVFRRSFDTAEDMNIVLAGGCEEAVSIDVPNRCIVTDSPRNILAIEIRAVNAQCPPADSGAFITAARRYAKIQSGLADGEEAAAAAMALEEVVGTTSTPARWNLLGEFDARIDDARSTDKETKRGKEEGGRSKANSPKADSGRHEKARHIKEQRQKKQRHKEMRRKKRAGKV